MLPIIGFYSGDREPFSQLYFYRQHFLLPAFLSAYIDHTAVGGIPRLCNITHTVQITQYLGDAGARDIQHFADIADADGFVLPCQTCHLVDHADTAGGEAGRQLGEHALQVRGFSTYINQFADAFGLH